MKWNRHAVSLCCTRYIVVVVVLCILAKWSSGLWRIFNDQIGRLLLFVRFFLFRVHFVAVFLFILSFFACDWLLVGCGLWNACFIDCIYVFNVLGRSNKQNWQYIWNWTRTKWTRSRDKSVARIVLFRPIEWEHSEMKQITKERHMRHTNDHSNPTYHTRSKQRTEQTQSQSHTHNIPHTRQF